MRSSTAHADCEHERAAAHGARRDRNAASADRARSRGARGGGGLDLLVARRVAPVARSSAQAWHDRLWLDDMRKLHKRAHRRARELMSHALVEWGVGCARPRTRGSRRASSRRPLSPSDARCSSTGCTAGSALAEQAEAERVRLWMKQVRRSLPSRSLRLRRASAPPRARPILHPSPHPLTCTQAALGMANSDLRWGFCLLEGGDGGGEHDAVPAADCQALEERLPRARVEPMVPPANPKPTSNPNPCLCAGHVHARATPSRPLARSSSPPSHSALVPSLTPRLLACSQVGRDSRGNAPLALSPSAPLRHHRRRCRGRLFALGRIIPTYAPS